MRGKSAVGDGVAECDNCPRAIHGLHVNAIKEVPRRNLCRVRKVRRGGCITVGDEVVLIREGVVGFRAHHLRRKIKADDEIRERLHGERNGIGEELRAGRNVDGCCSAEGNGVICSGLNGRAAGAQGHVRIAHDQRIQSQMRW